MESKGYICPQCKTIFSSLDVSRLLNVRTGSFDCDICPDSELQAYDPMVANSSSKSGNVGPHELHSRLMEQTRLIVELLKKADEISIPAFNPALWLDKNAAKYSMLVEDKSEEDSGPQLAIAGANSPETQLNVTVDLVDEESLRAATSSVSNPLPEWHMYSTITGEAIRHTESNAEITGTKEQVKDNVIEESGDKDDIVNYYSQIAADKVTTVNSEEEVENDEPAAKLTKLTTEPSKTIYVTVAGTQIPLDQLTEDDKDRMTEEEYSQYYEIYMSNQ